MLSLSDHQLRIVMTASGSLPTEKRSMFLERVAARLQLYGAAFTDAELDRALRCKDSFRIRLLKDGGLSRDRARPQRTLWRD